MNKQEIIKDHEWRQQCYIGCPHGNHEDQPCSEYIKDGDGDYKQCLKNKDEHEN